MLLGRSEDSKETSYQPLEDQDANQEDHHSTRVPKSWPRWTTYVMVVSLLLIELVGVLVYIHAAASAEAPKRDIQWKTCGNTSEEARSNDCVLDFISRSWLPRECYDAELANDFLAERPWRWYADKTCETELSKELIERGGGPDPIYVSDEYHHFHCAYMWKKLHRAMTRRTPIDSYIGNYKHTNHCANSLLAQKNDISRFYLVFPGCPVS